MFVCESSQFAAESNLNRVSRLQVSLPHACFDQYADVRYAGGSRTLFRAMPEGECVSSLLNPELFVFPPNNKPATPLWVVLTCFKSVFFCPALFYADRLDCTSWTNALTPTLILSLAAVRQSKLVFFQLKTNLQPRFHK